MVEYADIISRQAEIDAIVNTVSEIGLHDNSEVARYGATFRQHEIIEIIEGMLSAQPEQRPSTEDNYVYCVECDPEVKCLSCGHHIAERLFEVYCNIMCKWVNEKDYCTIFEPGQEKMATGYIDKQRRLMR